MEYLHTVFFHPGGIFLLGQIQPQSHHDLLTILKGMLFHFKEFTFFLPCFVQLKALVTPLYSSFSEQDITYATPGIIYNGNQLHPQTFHSFSVLVSTLLTPKCMGTSFWLLIARLKVCSSSAGTWPLVLISHSLSWSPLSTLHGVVSMCKWYNTLQCWHGLSSAPSFLFSSCFSFHVLLCNFSPSLLNNQHHTPVHQTEIQQFLIIHKSSPRVSRPNLLSWKTQRPAALCFQLFITSFF